MTSQQPARWVRWARSEQLSRVEWAYIAGLVVLTVAGIVFAFWYVARENEPPPPAPSDFAISQPSALGYLVSADDRTVVIELGNGHRRTFSVRPQDRANVGIGYLDAHAGSRESGFLIYYQSVNGTDYIVATLETDPPPPGGG